MKRLLQFLMFVCIVVLVVSCNDDDKIKINDTTTYIYHKIVPNEDGTSFVVLDSLSANVSAIDGAPDWCSVKQIGLVNVDNPKPIIELCHQEGTPNQQRTAATVHLKMEDGN